MSDFPLDTSLLRWPRAIVHDTVIVAVLNASPDSYFKGSVVEGIDASVERARVHIKHGAHIIEVGGLSGSTYAKRISAEDEARRTIDIVRAILEEFPQVGVSIDTFRPSVAEKAFEAGATWINDVTAMTFDPAMVELVRDSGARAVIMHLEGPGGHAGRVLHRPFYSDVVGTVYSFFEERIDELVSAGMSRDRLVVDVGLGTGKRPPHDYALLSNLSRFRSLGCDLMIAPSRKGFIRAVAPATVDELLGGSVVAALWAFLSGARYLRVHEVAAYAQGIDVWNAIVSTARWEPDEDDPVPTRPSP